MEQPLVSLDCVDAVLDACAERMLLGEPIPHPTDFLAALSVPASLRNFSREEIHAPVRPGWSGPARSNKRRVAIIDPTGAWYAYFGDPYKVAIDGPKGLPLREPTKYATGPVCYPVLAKAALKKGFRVRGHQGVFALAAELVTAEAHDLADQVREQGQAREAAAP
jgi:hypothetical protein